MTLIKSAFGLLDFHNSTSFASIITLHSLALFRERVGVRVKKTSSSTLILTFSLQREKE